MTEMFEKKLVTIARFTQVMDAEMAKVILGAEGIQAFVTGAEVVALAWHIGQATGYVRLEVAEEDAGQARQLLQAPAADALAEESEFDSPVEGETEDAASEGALTSMRRWARWTIGIGLTLWFGWLIYCFFDPLLIGPEIW